MTATPEQVMNAVDTTEFDSWYTQRFGPVDLTDTWQNAKRADAFEIWNASRSGLNREHMPPREEHAYIGAWLNTFQRFGAEKTIHIMRRRMQKLMINKDPADFGFVPVSGSLTQEEHDMLADVIRTYKGDAGNGPWYVKRIAFMEELLVRCAPSVES